MIKRFSSRNLFKRSFEMVEKSEEEAMHCLLEEIEGVLKDSLKESNNGNFNIFEQDSVAEELTKLVSKYELKPKDWAKYVHYDKMRYTRNLISIGSGNRFGLMILAWGPGQRSPIHDHDGSHCIMRVLEGSLVETLYNKEGSKEASSSDSDTSMSAPKYEKTRETVLSTGQTAYIHDKIGWHRVSNPSMSVSAISLHLYAPPIESCQTFCEIEGKVRAKAPCPYYSIGGVKQA